MKNYRLTKVFLGITFVLFSLGCTENSKKDEIVAEVPPNIIWLVAEDQSPDWFPMYGDSTIRLPHIEALARDGVTFDMRIHQFRFVLLREVLSSQECILRH